MASTPEAARQSLNIAGTNRANPANSRQSTEGGSVQNVQGRLVQPRWNASTKISSPTKNASLNTETAEQKMERFRKREKALVSKSISVRKNSGVSNPGLSLVDPQAIVAPASTGSVVHEPSVQLHPPVDGLPTEILSQILGNLDLHSRLITRNVSRNLRSIVDSEKMDIKCMEITTSKLGILIRTQYPKQCITFHQIQDSCSVKWRGKETIVRGRHCVNVALDFLKPILSNPKVKLEKIHVGLETSSAPYFRKLLNLMSEVVKTNNTKFHVGHVGIFDHTEERLDSWLPLFEPGVLHSLVVFVNTRIEVLNCSESEQFKRAKAICLNPYGGLKPSLIKHFLHLECFCVRLHSIPINDILRLMEDLSKSATFKQCFIRVMCGFDLNAIEDAFRLLALDPVEREGGLYLEVDYEQLSLCFWFQDKLFEIRRKSEDLHNLCVSFLCVS